MKDPQGPIVVGWTISHAEAERDVHGPSLEPTALPLNGRLGQRNGQPQPSNGSGQLDGANSGADLSWPNVDHCRHRKITFWSLLCLVFWMKTFALAASAIPVSGPTQKACAQEQKWAGLVQNGDNSALPAEVRKGAYRKAIELCPQSSVAYDHLAILLVQQRDYEKALADIRQGLKRSPKDPGLELDLGAALLSLGRPEEAVSVFKSAPLGAKGEFYLAMAYRALRNHEAARRALAKSIQMGNNDPYVFYALIGQDRALHDKQAGLRDFQLFYKRFPHSAWLHLLLGDAYRSRNENASAESEYRKALQLDPKLPVARFELGRIAFDQDNYLQAFQDFDGEVHVDPTFGEAYLYAGASLRRLGKNNQALTYLEGAVARDPNNALAYRGLAAAQVQAKRLAEAMKTLQEGERRFPEEEAFPAQLAALLRKSGEDKQAVAQANLAGVLSRKSNTLLSSRQKPVSRPATPRIASPTIAQLQQCIEREDAKCTSKLLNQPHGAAFENNAEYLNLEAQGFNLVHRDKLALAAIQRAIKINPHQASYFITEGQIYQKSGNQMAAIRSFLRAEQMQPGAATPVYDLGMSFFLLGYQSNVNKYYERAARHFQVALQLDPSDARAEFMLGVVNSITFKPSAAKKHFEAALKMDPRNPYYHLHYGMLLRRLGDLAEAKREMNTAERLDPSYARTYLQLGDLDEQMGRDVDARQQLEAAIRLEPHLPQAYYTLGRVYYRLGLKAKSRETLAKFQQMKSVEQEKEDPLGIPITASESRPTTERK